MMLLYVAYILLCKSGRSRLPKQFRMELMERIISENHRDEFSTSSGRPSISPSPLSLTSENFSDVIPAIEQKSSLTRQCTLCSRKRDSRGKSVRKETRHQCTECQQLREEVPADVSSSSLEVRPQKPPRVALGCHVQVTQFRIIVNCS
ncbi:piggyBac transposable element-derived protein 4 [Trichonephila clavipes]|nr:piggyBac transposable element-derived protein 4 [Trichonephila clavipes]